MIIGSNHTVTNAHQYSEKLKDVSLEENEAMVMFDVIARLTSVVRDLLQRITK